MAAYMQDRGYTVQWPITPKRRAQVGAAISPLLHNRRSALQNACGCAQIGGRFTQASPRKARCRPYSNRGRM